MLNRINSTGASFQLGQFQNNVLDWANYIDLIKGGCIHKQIAKIKEEVAEYQEAIENGNIEEAGKELADILVTCIVSAEQNNIKIVDYFQPTINKLVSRQYTGRIVDGSFVKAEDLA